MASVSIKVASFLWKEEKEEEGRAEGESEGEGKKG